MTDKSFKGSSGTLNKSRPLAYMIIESYMDENDIEDVMVLYNTINFAMETTLIKLNR